MSAMQLETPGKPLRLVRRVVPRPTGFDLVIKVAACGVCRTDLHIVDGDIHGTIPIVPGHEIVGRVIAMGPDVRGLAIGERVGVPWLGGTCGICFYCRSRRENLCDEPVFTGFTRDGGYGTHCLADSRFCLRIPDTFGDVEAAPLLCAGLIGYRALKLAGDGERLGLYGFGAAAHILAQMGQWQAERSTHSPGPTTLPGRHLLCRSAAPGRDLRTGSHRKNSMPRSSSRRRANWCRKRFGRFAKADDSSAREST